MDLDLDEIRRKTEAATAGEWFASQNVDSRRWDVAARFGSAPRDVSGVPKV